MKKKLKAVIAVITGLIFSVLAACGCGGNADNGGSGGTEINYNGTININLPTSEFMYEYTAL